MPDKSRKILDIMEVEGMKAGEIVLHPLYQFQKGEEGEEWFRPVSYTHLDVYKRQVSGCQRERFI